MYWSIISSQFNHIMLASEVFASSVTLRSAVRALDIPLRLFLARLGFPCRQQVASTCSAFASSFFPENTWLLLYRVQFIGGIQPAERIFASAMEQGEGCWQKNVRAVLQILNKFCHNPKYYLSKYAL